MEDRYIVVSDVHLGGYSNNEPYLDDFCKFLTWMQHLPNNGKISYKDSEGFEKTIQIQPPTKIILLGDILEMWDPKEHDRDNIIKDSTVPFSLLHDIDCEKIYVTGNHDEDVEEIAEKLKSFHWTAPYEFSLYARHYPEGDKIKNGESVNGVKYSFLHGHQFDREQITYTLGKILNTRFDPIDFVQDLANVSSTKRIPEELQWLLIGMWLVLLSGILLDLSFLKNSIGVLFAILGIMLTAYYFQESRRIVKERRESRWYSYSFLIAGIILILLLVYSWRYENNFFLFFHAAYYILTYVVLVSLIPRFITQIMRGLYLTFIRSKDKSVEEILRTNYNLDKDTMNVQVVVFGHTHKPGAFLYTQPERRMSKIFVNTGCWVKEDTFSEETSDVRTFAYIDREGISLLRWAGPVNIQCLYYYAHKDILRLI